MKVYLACTVRGDRGGVAAGRTICERLQHHGHEVLTTHLLADNVEAAETQLTEGAVYRRDIEWLSACDVLVAEASGSSYGVGFEVGFILGRAPQTHQRVVLTYDASRRGQISRLITGNSDPRCTAFAYKSLDELRGLIDEHFATASTSSAEHSEHIRDQFTRQAVPFAADPAIRNEQALGRIVEMAQAGGGDTVLDVACGPGLLACAFARVAQHVTGIDLTPKMLEQALALQRKAGLDNLTWDQGDVQSLPYPSGSFSIVSSRFAFHHFLDPLAVLKEMRRVCRPGGRIVVADTSPAPDKAEAFNRMERLRDPSHVRALSLDELLALFAAAELPVPVIRRDDLGYELESFLARSFPKDGNADRIRQLFDESIEHDRLGVRPVREHGEIRFLYPTAIVTSRL